MLGWIASARAALIPPATRTDSLLVDVACGGGLMTSYVKQLGYHHIGLDLTRSALVVAREHRLVPVQSDAAHLPLPDAIADVVLLGEILEHVTDIGPVVEQACRILRPGGMLIVDSIADTRRARLVAVTVAERIRGLAPTGIHDPALFVDRVQLAASCREFGVPLELTGIRLDLRSFVRWRTGRDVAARLVRSRSTAVMFQGSGIKA